MQLNRAIAFAGLLLSWPVAAIANDSVGHLSAGGIELARTNDIEMRQEELYVSMAEIRVRYRFFNKSDHDVDTLVAFPVPDLAAPSDTALVTVPEPGQDNFLGFATAIDGKPVAMNVELRAVALGVDRTERLRALGLPLSPYATSAAEAIARLPAAERDELERIGVLRGDVYSDRPDGAMTTHYGPSWTLRSTFHWRQLFPPGRRSWSSIATNLRSARVRAR